MTNSTTLYLLLPEILLIVIATAIYVVGAFVRLREVASVAAFGAILLAGMELFAQETQLSLFGESASAWTSGPLAVDTFGEAARWIALAVGAVLVCLGARGAADEQRAEEAASLLLIVAGLMLAVASNELILLFAGLELVSIPTYVLLYIGRHDTRGQEAASKYFFLSILSSAVLLYGFTFLYGVGGSTRLEQIASTIAKLPTDGEAAASLVPLAMLLIFAGLAFRLAAVPFHFYAPDVYQGTSNANAAVLSTLPKIVGLAVLARILLCSLPGWESLAWKLALVGSVLTMTLGNVLALWQNNVRRLLAYSSIAHAGYMLIGLAVALASQSQAAGTAAQTKGPFDGLGAAVFYLVVYVSATLGAFAALVYLSQEDHQADTLDDLAGLNRRHPLVALAIAVFMFSLMGIPPLAGFWGKFTLLFSALTLDDTASAGELSVRPWFVGLAIVTVLNAAIAAAYYLRVVGAMYFRPATDATARGERSVGPAAALIACFVLVVGIGLLPGHFIGAANQAGRSLRPSMNVASFAGPPADVELVYAQKTATPGLPQLQAGVKN